MSIMNDIVILEQELFKLLEYAFYYSECKSAAKLAVTLEAIKQLETDYSSMTKTSFLKKENIDRLTQKLNELKNNIDNNTKEWNELTKRLK